MIRQAKQYFWTSRSMLTRLVVAGSLFLNLAAIIYYTQSKSQRLEYDNGRWTYFSNFNHFQNEIPVPEDIHERFATSRLQLISFLRGDDGTDCTSTNQVPTIEEGLTRHFSDASISTNAGAALEGRRIHWCKKGKIIKRYLHLSTFYPGMDRFSEHFDAFVTECIQLYDGQFQSEKRINTGRGAEVQGDSFLGGTYGRSRIDAVLEWKDSTREVIMRLWVYDAGGGPRITILITDTASEAVGLDL